MSKPGIHRRRHRTLAALAVLASLGVSIGCAATPVRSDPLAARFHSEAALRARLIAPDLYARAQHALRARAHAESADARSHHAERAALLLDAAIAESRRLAAESAAASAEARWVRAVDQRARLDQRRQALEAQRERERAGGLAEARVQRALALDRSGRAHASSTDRGDPLSTRQAAEVLRERALLVLAAATAFGLEPERSAALELVIARAARKPDPDARFGGVRNALRDAESALRETREPSK